MEITCPRCFERGSVLSVYVNERLTSMCWPCLKKVDGILERCEFCDYLVMDARHVPTDSPTNLQQSYCPSCFLGMEADHDLQKEIEKQFEEEGGEDDETK